MEKPPSETALTIFLRNQAEIHVLGMDKPERIEGSPWDGGILDEIGNMKKKAWPEHVRPSLSDRKGWCDFIGVPEGRNHYYELDKHAREVFAKATKENKIPEWNAFWWPSADILPPEEIEAARRDLDELTFQQEYEASFIHFAGQAYYPFKEELHCARLQYNKKATLIFCFDFNVAPGTASVIQQQSLPEPSNLFGSGVIGEVWIERGSNTIKVCNQLINDWGRHEGLIICYGDSAGGAQGSAKVQGSDWQLIKQVLGNHFGLNRVHFKVPKANPRERDRVNSVNARLMSTSGKIRLMVDPRKAPHVVTDFEGVQVTDDGSGKLEKKDDLKLTHLTDGIGYYIWKEWPLKKRYVRSGQKYWK
ncbi:MAG: hypothetical protein DRJ03_01200 [Chloroflexi bacterium]|nr:MAG: hypothetical protein DRJ03_01200 [Chloroflexota bacterium]